MQEQTFAVLSPRQYVFRQVADYPTLYYGKSYEECAFKVFDQLFNVIGNGIRDQEEMMEYLSVPPVDEQLAKKYMTGEPIYWCYKQVNKWNMGEGEPDKLLESELALVRDQYPLTVDATKKLRGEPEFRVPYPNFQKQYSMVWFDEFLDLDQEWKDAAIWFYTKCKDFFMTNSQYYHYAFPTSSLREDANRVYDMEERIKKYDSWNKVTEDYGVEYLGDVEDFLSRRWQKELNKIMSFIDGTLARLKNE